MGSLERGSLNNFCDMVRYQAQGGGGSGLSVDELRKEIKLEDDWDKRDELAKQKLKMQIHPQPPQQSSTSLKDQGQKINGQR